jgi:hypothetical protein
MTENSDPTAKNKSTRQRVLLSILLAAVVAFACIQFCPAIKTPPLAAPEPPALSEFPTMPRLLWPRGSEHTFSKPDPAWKLKKCWLKPSVNSFEVKSAATPYVAGYSISIEYCDNDLEKPNEWRKLCRWDANGRLTLEIDRTGDERFSREFDENGTLRMIEHRRGDKWIPKWIGAVSFDAAGIEVARVEDGSGKIIRRCREPGSQDHSFIHDGTLYLFTRVASAKITKAELQTHNDSFTIDLATGTENLRLSSEPALGGQWTPGERWSKSRGAPPALFIDTQYINGDNGSTAAYFLDEKTQRRKQELATRTEGYSLNGPRDHIDKEIKRHEAEEAARAALRVPEYARLRSEFLYRYAKYLKEIGTSVETTGLSDVITKPEP